MSAQSDYRRLFDNHAIQRVKLGVFDIDGVLRGKYISLDKFFGSIDSGVGFCDVIFGWDSGDVLYDNATITGWHTGYPDGVLTIDSTTFRTIPWEPGTAFFLLDTSTPVAPRQVLWNVVDRAQKLGYVPHCSAEYEFFCFKETPESVRAKSYRGLDPLSPGMFGYSVLRASENSAFVLALLDQLNAFGIPLEGLHTETGPGVYEAAIAVDRALAAADKAALFKTAVKEISARHGVMPTFMAKWSGDLPGSSGHIHQSLWNADGKNIFTGPSETMMQYIAGLVEHLPALMAIFCPTINSYKRTVPGAWAPVNATWGVDNRTTAVRAIPGSAKSTRVELRITGADINPYLAMAAALAAGIDGIERKLVPGEATTNAYAGDAAPLPRTLKESTALFRESAVAREWLGAAFVDHYARTREWEVRQYEKAVTNWELERYFEII